MILFIADVTKPDYYNILIEHLQTYYRDVEFTKLSVNADIQEFTKIPDLKTVVWFLQDPVINRVPIWMKCEQIYLAMVYHYGKDNIRHINRYNGCANMVKTVTLAGARSIDPTFAPNSKSVYEKEQLQKFLSERKLLWFVREDMYHGHNMVIFEKDNDYDDEIKLSHIREMRHPAAIQFIDCWDMYTNRFWKYRVMVIGNEVIPVHVQSGKKWVVHGEDRLQDESEISFEYAFCTNPVTWESGFRRLKEFLGVDWCMFDFGLDPEGKPKIFEASTFPFIHYIDPPRTPHHMFRNDITKSIIDKLVRFFIEA